MSDAGTDRRAAARALSDDRSLSFTRIAELSGASITTLRRWAKADSWPPRDTTTVEAGQPTPLASPDATASAPTATRSPKRKALVARLYRLIDHNIRILESRMSDDNLPAGHEPERDTRVVGSLVRSVEKLKDLEPGKTKRDKRSSTTGGTRSLLTPEEEDQVRRKVVEHILRLRERKRRERDAG